jgi:hypothetical protein
MSKNGRHSQNPFADPFGQPRREIGGSAFSEGRQDPSAVEFEEYFAVSEGFDAVECSPENGEKVGKAFNGGALIAAKSWLKGRPGEPVANAAAVIKFPRMWSTQRGRYSRFKVPGGKGVYGLLRARPSY